MRINTHKKFLAACLSGVMVLCLLAGCSNTPATQTTESTTNNPVVAGMLILSTNASVNITYDTEGIVTNISGTNYHGIDLVSKYSDYAGKTCAVVAKELINTSVEAELLPAETKNVIIKQAVHLQAPNSDLLNEVAAEVKAAVEAADLAAVVTVIDETMQDENGYINLDTAKALLCNELGVEKLDKYYGSAAPYDGVYICTVEVAGVQTSHSIDAVTGLIADATEEDLLNNPDIENELTGGEEDDLPVEEPTADVE